MVDAVAGFFEWNRPLVYFVYGLVFFVLGLAIALQSRAQSRLLLARRLRWLAAFGLLHGLHEWGDLFIPLQAAFLPPPVFDLLLALQQILLAVSFACLLQFAVDLVRPLHRGWAWVRWVPLAVAILWAGLAAVWIEAPTMRVWANDAGIWARYVLGFPAAAATGLALILRARSLLAPLDDPPAVRWLRIAGAAFLAYGVASGLVVPPGSFWPASVLNTELLEGAVGVPVPVYRSLIALVVVIAFVRLLHVFDLELRRTLGAVEEAQLLASERARLGRDLHDRTLQSVYAAGLVVNACLEIQRREGRARAAESLSRAMLSLDRAVEDLRSHIAELRSPPTSMHLADGLRERVRASAVEAVADVSLELDVPEDLALLPTAGGHVLAIAGEALSNIARHSGARHVNVSARMADGDLHLEIADDGRGIPLDYVSGYGLQNMHDRARILGADLQIYTGPGEGTRLELSVPLEGATG